jgi:DNA polymerase elongation subunit (family B)
MTPIPFYVVDWHSSDANPDAEDEDDKSEESASDSGAGAGAGASSRTAECKKIFSIQAFCIDEENKSVVLNINGFKPYFFIKVPFNWSMTQATFFTTGIKEKVDRWFRNTLVDFKLIKAKPFYGFTAGDKFLYLKLSFSCLGGFKKFGDLFLNKNKIRIPMVNNGQPYYYEPYESNLQPLLRFMHCRDINAAGWLGVENPKTVWNRTTSDYEVSCIATDVNPLKDMNALPPIKYVGFDIEADSSHGDFPIAKKDYQKLAQDIVTEYNRIADERHFINLRPFIATCIYYAFNTAYTNNNIYSVRLLDPVYPDVTDIINGNTLPMHLKKLINDTSEQVLTLLQSEDQEGLFDLLEKQYPMLNVDFSDYYTVSVQLLKDYQRLKQTNDLDLKRDPLKVITLMLTLVLDPYYLNLNINRVYTRQGKKPSPELLMNLVPTVFSMCEKAYQIVIQDRKDLRYRKMKLKVVKDKSTTKIDEAPEKVDTYVQKLKDVFNKFLPPLKDDQVIQIGSTFKRYGESDCYLKHIICLKGCEPINNETMINFEYQGVEIPKGELIPLAVTLGLLKKGDPPGDLVELNTAVLEAKKRKQTETDKSQVIVETYETEQEVLLAWQKLIVKENPDMIVGYNIFGFDYKFMYDRAEQLGIAEEFSKLGRFKGKPGKLVEQKLQSAGRGDNLFHYIEMSGRVSIDLYKVMQMMYQLDSYKLDSVCKKFLYKSKVDVSPADIFVKQKGTDADRRVIAEYCLIDCVLCNRLMDKLELIINNIGMAQVCSVPFSYLFMRGQGIKLFSYVAKRCRQEGHLIPVLDEAEDEGKYEGAIVLNPIKGIHYDVVAVADFNSLYPSCMISENLSHNSYVGSIIVNRGDPTDFRGRCLGDTVYEQNLINGHYAGWDYVDIVYDLYRAIPVGPGRKKTKNIVTGHKICRFAQPPNGKKDIIPSILMDLLKQRKVAKNTAAEYPKGSFMYNLYEGLQLAYKVTANSLYGIIGANTSQIRLKEIAACTTATGRQLITFSAGFITKNYPGSRIVYGDTDSVFASFKCVDRKGRKLQGLDAVMKNIMHCTEAAMLISKQLKYPHNLEFEKAIFPFILLSKKRYHGHYFTAHGSSDFSAKSMGIVLKRRDNAQIVKHVFGGMIKIIMEEHSIEKAIKFVITECTKVLRGDFPIDMFIISKTLRSYYKNPQQIPHNVLAQRIGKRDPGNKPNSNDRIPYVFIINPDAETQGDRIETPDYVQRHKCKIDYGHYITNQIQKPVMQIFELAGKGLNVFDNLISEYQMMLLGQTKLSGPGIKILDRATMGIRKHVKKTDNDESSSEDDDDTLEDRDELELEAEEDWI